jgi:hypothetical protein
MEQISTKFRMWGIINDGMELLLYYFGCNIIPTLQEVQIKLYQFSQKMSQTIRGWDMT